MFRFFLWMWSMWWVFWMLGRVQSWICQRLSQGEKNGEWECLPKGSKLDQVTFELRLEYNNIIKIDDNQMWISTIPWKSRFAKCWRWTNGSYIQFLQFYKLIFEKTLFTKNMF
jgi:hypothetical protein